MTTTTDRFLYTARSPVTGGRAGNVQSDDGFAHTYVSPCSDATGKILVEAVAV
ncbi:hypothetical protein [Solicola gregarius]|uniref:Uncharacterized protein n=1 Tax=Solicola gregarius TaxID=2908642 RepID=A0AA46TGL4_9ACTN|nr:hypothetical protein [Solicola gregarius]UYM04989.1 hypothetical protein L0C25_21095 [Solicola gregarius]